MLQVSKDRIKIYALTKQYSNFIMSLIDLKCQCENGPFHLYIEGGACRLVQSSGIGQSVIQNGFEKKNKNKRSK